MRASASPQTRFGIPYALMSGIKYWSRKEVKDVVAYLRLLVNPSDNLALLRIINVPSRKVGTKAIEQLAEWAVGQDASLAQVAASRPRWGEGGAESSFPGGFEGVQRSGGGKQEG